MVSFNNQETKTLCCIKSIEREWGKDINKDLLNYSEEVNTFHDTFIGTSNNEEYGVKYHLLQV